MSRFCLENEEGVKVIAPVGNETCLPSLYYRSHMFKSYLGIGGICDSSTHRCCMY